MSSGRSAVVNGGDGQLRQPIALAECENASQLLFQENDNNKKKLITNYQFDYFLTSLNRIVSAVLNALPAAIQMSLESE